MKLKAVIGFALPCLTLLAASPQAAEVDATKATAATPAESATTIDVVITPNLFAFDYFVGVTDNKTPFLDRYDYRKGFSGDTRSGVFGDLDLDVTVNNGERDLFILERRGFGQYNHRGATRYSNDALSVSGAYSHFRSATGGIDYLFSPGQVAGGTVSVGGPYTTFNDNANRYDFIIDRTTYSAGLKVKPAVLGGSTTLSVDYEGYTRDGNKFAPLLLDTFGGGGLGTERWRGINLDVSEHMNRVGLTLTASPRRLLEVAYEVAFEQFLSDAPELQMQRDITDPAGLPLPAGISPVASLFYVPDTSLMTQGLKISKNFSDHVVVVAGYGASLLKQDSYRQQELATGHTQGQINTNNAYLAANAYVMPQVSVEGHIKSYNHDNNATFPDGLINLSTLVAPRINSIDSLDYGLSANWRPDFLGSNFTLGWRRLDTGRDLTWGTAGNNILPPQSLYHEDTVSNETYLKWIARPATGWTIRLTPSFIRADKTGLVSEPEETFLLKVMTSYATPEGWVVSGFYDYKKKQNNNHTFTDANGALTYTQNIDSSLYSAGLSLSLMPRDSVNVQANLYWVQNDFKSYLFTTNVQRWNPPVTFTLVDDPNYKVNSYVFSLGGDWQASDMLKLNGSYTFSKSKGDVASGIVLTDLQSATGTVDSIIDNTLHSLSLGADYLFTNKTTLRAKYIYDYYDDNAYSLLTGGASMLAIGVSFAIK
jgi:hypothetical protein